MRVITGGAYNGKRHFVKEFYHLTDGADFIKYTGYNNDKLPVDLLLIKTKYIIIQHLGMYVKKFFEIDTSISSHNEAFDLYCLKLQDRNPDSKLNLIGDDISKGVVPTNRQEREWRDMTGLLYQRLIQASDRFDIIWYGINKQLK